MYVGRLLGAVLGTAIGLYIILHRDSLMRSGLRDLGLEEEDSEQIHLATWIVGIGFMVLPLLSLAESVRL